MRFNFYLDDNYGLDGEARAHPRDSHVILPLPISTRVRSKRSSAIFLAVPHISLYRVLPLLSKGGQVVKFEFKSYAKFSELPIPNRCPTCDQVEGGCFKSRASYECQFQPIKSPHIVSGVHSLYAFSISINASALDEHSRLDLF